MLACEEHFEEVADEFWLLLVKTARDACMAYDPRLEITKCEKALILDSDCGDVWLRLFFLTQIHELPTILKIPAELYDRLAPLVPACAVCRMGMPYYCCIVAPPRCCPICDHVASLVRLRFNLRTHNSSFVIGSRVGSSSPS